MKADQSTELPKAIFNPLLFTHCFAEKYTTYGIAALCWQAVLNPGQPTLKISQEAPDWSKK